MLPARFVGYRARAYGGGRLPSTLRNCTGLPAVLSGSLVYFVAIERQKADSEGKSNDP